MESIGGEKGEEDDKFDEMCGKKRHDERMPRRLPAFAPRSMERAMERISVTRSRIAEAAEVSRENEPKRVRLGSSVRRQRRYRRRRWFLLLLWTLVIVIENVGCC